MNFTLFVLTLVDSVHSQRRLTRLSESIKSLPCSSDIKIIRVQLQPQAYDRNEIIAFSRARDFQQENGGLVGFCQDDTVLHPKFCSEFELTLVELPSTWGVLHLCPGFSWGKKFPNHEILPLQYRPERQFKMNPRSKRYWNGPPSKSAWLGGPEAFIVKDVHFWNDIIRHIRNGIGITDVDLTLNAIDRRGRDFVARDPPLCREIDDGYSLRQKKQIPT